MKRLQRITPENAKHIVELARLNAQGDLTWSSKEDVLAISRGETLRLYRIQPTIELLHQPKWEFDDDMRFLVFSPDLSKFVIKPQRGNCLYICDTQTSKTIGCLDPSNPSNHLKESLFSAAGKLLVSRSHKTSYLWDVDEKRLLLSLPGYLRFAFSPDETKLAAAGDGRLHLWDLKTGALVSFNGMVS